MPQYERPPLGLRPRIIAEEQRLQEIKEAIMRFMTANREIPQEWVAEYNELATKGSVCDAPTYSRRQR